MENETAYRLLKATGTAGYQAASKEPDVDRAPSSIPDGDMSKPDIFQVKTRPDYVLVPKPLARMVPGLAPDHGIGLEDPPLPGFAAAQPAERKDLPAPFAVHPCNPRRKLVAIMNADVVDYCRLMNDDEAATVRDMVFFKAVFREHIERHGGRVLDAVGDNLMAEFPSVVEAVRCGVLIQLHLEALNKDSLEHRKMAFRIGINVGDVIDQGNRIFGDGVNIAARLQKLADPGGICISRTVHDQVEDKLALGYKYLGEKKVRNLPKRVHAYRVLLKPGGTPPVKTKQKGSGIHKGRTERPAERWKKWLPAITGFFFGYTLVHRFRAARP